MIKLNAQTSPVFLEKLSLEYVRTFMDWFPVGFLEGLEANLLNVKNHLDLNQISTVIGHDTISNTGYFISTVARMNGKKIIGVQHGGHYGYIEDLSVVGQFEYAFYDKMITWGWEKIDSHFPKCEMIPLPCPKLSEKPLKANYTSSIHLNLEATKDILFFSNLFHRFPHISTCGQARVDFIDEITSSQEKLMQEVDAGKLTIDHKPYNMKFTDLYPEHYNRLELAGGRGYRLLNSTHKGITEEFIKTCRIVLWDQIGSGTLECFTSEVPTIVYWPRIYSREASWAKHLIDALERTGVIHKDPKKLVREIKTYLADPPSWMENSERKKAIDDFCKIYGLTDIRWHKKWKKALHENFCFRNQ
jgi:putative transferase (TIGR04331 family)